MSAQPAPANLHPEPAPHAPGQQATDAQYYRHALHDLIDIGTGLARLLHQQAITHAAQQPTAPAAPQAPAPQPAPPPAPATPTPNALISIAAAFDCTARAVRRSILLARSLATPLPPASDPAGHRAAARKRILREVEDTIQRTAPVSRAAASDGSDAEGPEALTAELRDRLDAPDLDDDISTRPVADIIAEICRDLGLAARPGTHPWKRRTPADLEQLCARAAAPSRPRPPGTEPLAPATPHHAATNPVPPGPAAVPHATSPIQAGSSPPNGPADTPAASQAEAVATIPCHPCTFTANGACRPSLSKPLEVRLDNGMSQARGRNRQPIPSSVEERGPVIVPDCEDELHLSAKPSERGGRIAARRLNRAQECEHQVSQNSLYAMTVSCSERGCE